MRWLGLAVPCLAAGVLMGCGGAAKSETPAAEASASTAADASASGEFGVKACDDYMTKYTACINAKVPESSRPEMNQALEHTKVQWKALAATDAGRQALTAACTQASALAKSTTQAYGCDW
jgi:hypothetical protein